MGWRGVLLILPEATFYGAKSGVERMSRMVSRDAVRSVSCDHDLKPGVIGSGERYRFADYIGR